MQNRFVMTGVPVSARTPAGESSLKEFVESKTCWIDRFAWITPDPAALVQTCAFELHLENWRGPALARLEGAEVRLDGREAGGIRSVLGSWIADQGGEEDGTKGDAGEEDDEEDYDEDEGEGMSLSGAKLEAWLNEEVVDVSSVAKSGAGE